MISHNFPVTMATSFLSPDEVQVVATIFDDVEENAGVTIYTSTFFSPVAGTIYFRQVQGAKETTIFGKVYHVTSSVVTSGHNWHVHENAVSRQLLFYCTREGTVPRLQ